MDNQFHALDMDDALNSATILELKQYSYSVFVSMYVYTHTRVIMYENAFEQSTMSFHSVCFTGVKKALMEGQCSRDKKAITLNAQH